MSAAAPLSRPVAARARAGESAPGLLDRAAGRRLSGGRRR
jgi:hypothetical protein